MPSSVLLSGRVLCPPWALAGLLLACTPTTDPQGSANDSGSTTRADTGDRGPSADTGPTASPDSSGSTPHASDDDAPSSTSGTMNADDADDGQTDTDDDDDTTGDPGTDAADFTTLYIAGTTKTGFADLDEVGLESRPQRIEMRSDGDLMVWGEEEYNAGGAAGILWGNAVWRFSGTDGTLVWKDVDHYLDLPRKVGFVGVGPDDASYVAVGVGLAAPGVRKYDPDGNEEWTTDDALTAQLDEALEAIGGIASAQAVIGGVVTQDNVVVVEFAIADHVLFAAYESASQQLFISSLPETWPFLPPVERPSGDLLTFGVDVAQSDGTQGQRVTLLDVSMPGGELASTPIDTSALTVGPANGDTSYEPYWSPVDFVEVPGSTDSCVLLSEQYWDNAAERYHLIRVSATGELIGSVLVGPDGGGDFLSWQSSSLAATADGLLVVGHYSVTAGPFYDTFPSADRFSWDLDALGDYSLAALDGYEMRWDAAASSGTRTLIAGEIENATIVLHSAIIGQ